MGGGVEGRRGGRLFLNLYVYLLRVPVVGGAEVPVKELKARRTITSLSGDISYDVMIQLLVLYAALSLISHCKCQ